MGFFFYIFKHFAKSPVFKIKNNAGMGHPRDAITQKTVWRRDILAGSCQSQRGHPSCRLVWYWQFSSLPRRQTAS